MVLSYKYSEWLWELDLQRMKIQVFKGGGHTCLLLECGIPRGQPPTHPIRAASEWENPNRASGDVFNFSSLSVTVITVPFQKHRFNNEVKGSSKYTCVFVSRCKNQTVK